MDETLGDRIERLRVAKGLRQADLAEIIGVSSGTVLRWEGNKNGPNEANARALGREFSQPWTEFFSEDLTASPVGRRLDQLEKEVAELKNELLEIRALI